MNHSFKAISISYKTAPIVIRESVSLNEEAIRSLLEQLKAYIPGSDFLVVSTCNRTEVYYSSDKDCAEEIIKLIAIEKGSFDSKQTCIKTSFTHRNEKYQQVSDAQFNTIRFSAEVLSYFEIINDSFEAIKHLFNVALGLESQVVGDLQISNQVKKSYQLSADANTAGPFLHRLMHTIFAASKRVQQQTGFRDEAASVSYATVELVKEMSAQITDPRILLIGLGEIGTDVCKNLIKANFGTIVISNRTIEKAYALSRDSHVEVVEWEKISLEIAKADVIISAVPGIQLFFSKESLQKSLILSHKSFIDLSVPRSIETSIEEIPGVLLFNVDDIKNRASEALEKRKAAIPQVQSIIAEMTEGFDDWSKESGISSVIQEFKDALDKIRQQEINRHIKNLTEEESQKVDAITKSIVQRILKLPVLQLKAACQRGEADQLSEVLRSLFDLEGKKQKA